MSIRVVASGLIAAAGVHLGRRPTRRRRPLTELHGAAAVRLQAGNRKGAWAALMQAAVERLTVDDMVANAAYTASREP